MKKMDLLKAIGFFFFTFSLIFSGVISFNHYSNLKIIKSFEAENSTLEQKLKTLQGAIKSKNNFILDLAKNSKKIADFKNKMFFLENINLETQDDFDRFESINSEFNQLIASEAVLLNSAEKSLFPNEASLRKMETLDLTIDKSRLEFSKATFTMNENLKKLRFDPFLKQKLSKAPIFKIDQLILSSK